MLHFKEPIMNPFLVAAAVPLFLLNPVVGALVVGGLAGSALGITAAVIKITDEEKEKKKNATPSKEIVKPVAKAIQHVQHIEKKATNTIQEQKTTVKAATSTLKHDNQRLNQTTAKIERAATSIETQTERTQVHVHEMNRLRSSVALTTAALKANQKTLEKTEVKLGDTTQKLQKTQKKLDESVALHQAVASNVLSQTIKLHATQKKIVEPLLKSKDVEIAGLRNTLRTINRETTALQNESMFASKLPQKTQDTPATKVNPSAQQLGAHYVPKK